MDQYACMRAVSSVLGLSTIIKAAGPTIVVMEEVPCVLHLYGGLHRGVGIELAPAKVMA